MDANVRHIVREVIEEYLAEHLPGLLEVAEKRKQDKLKQVQYDWAKALQPQPSGTGRAPAVGSDNWWGGDHEPRPS